MGHPEVLTAIFVKFANTPVNSHLSPAEERAWQLCRQEIRPAGPDQLELVEQVVVSGLTLNAAWRAMSVYATALSQKEKQVQ